MSLFWSETRTLLLRYYAPRPHGDLHLRLADLPLGPALPRSASTLQPAISTVSTHRRKKTGQERRPSFLAPSLSRGSFLTPEGHFLALVRLKKSEIECVSLAESSHVGSPTPHEPNISFDGHRSSPWRAQRAIFRRFSTCLAAKTPKFSRVSS